VEFELKAGAVKDAKLYITTTVNGAATATTSITTATIVHAVRGLTVQVRDISGQNSIPYSA
jgi:hypothetical protein